MRLPGSIIQGILARAALVVLRVYLGGAILLSSLAHLRQAAGSSLGVMPLWVKLAIGVLLVLGLLTRLTAAAVLVVMLSVLLRRGVWPSDPLAMEPAVIAISLALLIGAAGRTWGIDAALARRWPRSPFW
jgi:uncharacterized membrane protein YphA (DoxX/SURF4 family)